MDSGNGDENMTVQVFPFRAGEKCIICGATDSLTEHHIVPMWFLRRFPKEIRIPNVKVTVCDSCHKKYEQRYGTPMLYKIQKQVGIVAGVDVETGFSESEMMKVRSAAAALLRHRDKLPAVRIDELEQRVSNYLCKREWDSEDLEALAEMKYVFPNTADAAVGYIEAFLHDERDYRRFVNMWRRNFVKAARRLRKKMGVTK